MKEKIFEEYAEKVANEFRINLEDLFTTETAHKYVNPRHMLFLLCDSHKMGSSEIARYMRLYGATTKHSTVINGLRRMSMMVKHDRDYYHLFKKIQSLN